MYTIDDIKAHQDMLIKALNEREITKSKDKLKKINRKINNLKSELAYMIKEMD